jgi:hypothetical protein
MNEILNLYTYIQINDHVVIFLKLYILYYITTNDFFQPTKLPYNIIYEAYIFFDDDAILRYRRKV